MQQVAEGRKKERDYKNIEDQIRCMKARLASRQQMDGDEDADHEQNNDKFELQKSELTKDHSELQQQRAKLSKQYEM